MSARRLLPTLALAAAVAAFAAAAAPRSTHAGGAGFCGEQRLFGYIRSLTKSGAGYRLRFDPALFLTGATANEAAARDGVVPKGEPVPNDNYVVNESRRTYLYVVPASTPVTVLLKGPNNVTGTRVSVARLAAYVHGKRLGELFERLDTGFWLGVHVDRACSLTQQYKP